MVISLRGGFVWISGYAPRSRSFHPFHALSRHCFASSGRCWESLTDARVCNASTLFWSVSRARSISRSQVFSAAGSKLSKPQVRHQSSYVGSSLPKFVRWIHPYLNHADQHSDNRPFDVGVRIRVRPCRTFLSLVLSCQDVQRRLVIPEREMRILIAQLGQVQVRRVRGCRWGVRVWWD